MKKDRKLFYILLIYCKVKIPFNKFSPYFIVLKVLKQYCFFKNINTMCFNSNSNQFITHTKDL